MGTRTRPDRPCAICGQIAWFKMRYDWRCGNCGKTVIRTAPVTGRPPDSGQYIQPVAGDGDDAWRMPDVYPASGCVGLDGPAGPV
jgi:hypothetical protein